MNDSQKRLVDDLIINQKMADREATILRLLAEDMDDFNISELTDLFENNIVTVGFTIDQLDTLLNDFHAARLAETTGQRLIGWMFRFPKRSEDNPEPLIADIIVNRMDISVTDDDSIFAETPLLYRQEDDAPDRTIDLTPKIFFQRKDVSNEQTYVPYPPAFDATLPRARTLRTLPMSTLEGYFPWADLAMLQRSDLDNFVDYIMRGNTAYTDIFFSGANMEYATMHNPTMRLEQLNLKDGTTTPPSPIPITDSRRPFTIKAEPYIATLNVTKDWIRQGTTPQDAPTPIVEGEADTAEMAAATALPMAAQMLPCPTIWDISNQISTSAARLVDSPNAEVKSAFQNSLMTFFYDPESSGNAFIKVDEVSLDDIRPPEDSEPDIGGETPTDKPTGCLSFLKAFFLILFIFWIVG